MLNPILLCLACAGLLFFALPASAQKTAKDSDAPQIQKNSDGTTTTTEPDADGGTKKTTRDKEGKLVDIVYTKPDASFGEGGTKVVIESYKDGTKKTLIQQKNKFDKIRHIEISGVNKDEDYTTLAFDYGEDGKLAAGKETFGLINPKLLTGAKIQYDKQGRPLTLSVTLREEGEGLKKYKLNHKYDDNNKSASPTLSLEVYNEVSEKWEATNLDNHTLNEILLFNVKETALLEAIRSATERPMSLLEDLPQIKDSMEDKPEGPAASPKSKTATTPSTNKEARPRLGSKPAGTRPRPRSGVAADPRPPASSTSAAKGAIDPCLVGTWRSESLAIPGSVEQTVGGSGILITVRADGTIGVDYNGMQPRTDQLGTHVWMGTATGHLTADKGIAAVTIEKSDLSRKYTDSKGVTRTNPLSGLGPASLGNPPERTYICDATTLRYQSYALIFTFKRFGTAPPK